MFKKVTRRSAMGYGHGLRCFIKSSKVESTFFAWKNAKKQTSLGCATIEFEGY